VKICVGGWGFFFSSLLSQVQSFEVREYTSVYAYIFEVLFFLFMSSY